MTLEDIKRFFTSAHVLHMEREIELLRGQNNMLQLQIMEALRPKQPPAPIKREFPVIAPARTSWETFLAEEIRKQETEEPTDGIHSSGR